jgi:hypothetical protein
VLSAVSGANDAATGYRRAAEMQSALIFVNPFDAAACGKKAGRGKCNDDEGNLPHDLFSVPLIFCSPEEFVGEITVIGIKYKKNENNNLE